MPQPSLHPPPRTTPSRPRLSTLRSNYNSNVWLTCFGFAVIAILFSQEISDFFYSNDQDYILKLHSSKRPPNISAWSVVPMPWRGGGYGVVATRQILPGELIMKETPLVKIKVGHINAQNANENVYKTIQELSGEDRNRFLSLSNAWENLTINRVQLNSYSGILQTNGMSSGRGYISIFPSIARLNHACTGAVNAVYNWRQNEGVQVVHVTKKIEAGEEIFVTYFDSKLPRSERQFEFIPLVYLLNPSIPQVHLKSFLHQAYAFNCSCKVCSLDAQQAGESDHRITRINSLKATLSAWSAGSIGGSEAVQLIEDAIDLMTQEGMTYELGQLYADAAHVATAHSDFKNARRYALLASKHFSIELGPDSVEVLVANKIFKNPTSSVVWGNRIQESVRKLP